MNGGEWGDPIEKHLLRVTQIELEKKWKEMEDKKGISKDAHLKIELNKLPTHWIQAIFRELGYLEKMGKEEQIEHIAHILHNKKFLKKILVELSRSSLFILKYLLSKGGWATFQCLSRHANTDENSDSWWWTDNPPTSPMGQLRSRGLIFVGRAPVKKRLYKIAVIPRELRKILEQVLPEVYRLKNTIEQKRGEKKSFLYTDEGSYLELLEEVGDYFKNIPGPSIIDKEQIVGFLRYLRGKNLSYEEIDQAWEDIQYFINFTDQFFFNKRGLDDFKIWEFSYFVSRFIPEEYEEADLTYEQVRRILYTIAEFYGYLKKRGEVKSDAEIQKAISRILQNDGKVVKVPIPPAKGPEILLVAVAPGSNKEIPFTNNDFWSAIVIYLKYNENWQLIISDLDRGKDSNREIVDALRKKNYLIHLRKKMEESRVTPSQLLSFLKPDKREIDRAIRWFYKKKLLIY